MRSSRPRSVSAAGLAGRRGELALVTVLQKAENLTDRQAADQVRTSPTWKYALGLELADPGFDPTVLAEFRTRVVEHHLEERALDLLLAALVERGQLAAGGKQRIDTWRLSASKTKQDRLALDYARDGFALLGALYAPASPSWLREVPAVQMLRQVLVQNYTRTVAGNGREVVKRREMDTETVTASRPATCACPPPTTPTPAGPPSSTPSGTATSSTSAIQCGFAARRGAGKSAGARRWCLGEPWRAVLGVRDHAIAVPVETVVSVVLSSPHVSMVLRTVHGNRGVLPSARALDS
jgi:hypothetical protein